MYQTVPAPGAAGLEQGIDCINLALAKGSFFTISSIAYLQEKAAEAG